MEKSNAHKIDVIICIMIFISFFTTDWDYLNTDDGKSIKTLVYVVYAVLIGIGVAITGFAYSSDGKGVKPATMDTDQIKSLRFKSTIFFAIGIILGAYPAVFLGPGEGIGLYLLSFILIMIGIVMGLQAKSQETRLNATT